MKRISAFTTVGARALARLALAAIVFTGLMPMTAHAAPFDNGSFETPVIGTDLQNFPTNSAIGAWTVIAGNVDVVRSDRFAAAHGNQSVDLNGNGPNSNGLLCQAFDTQVGTQYNLNFAMSRNGEGNTPSATLDVFVDNIALGTFTHNAPLTAANPAWEPHDVSFTATSAASVVCFFSTVPTGGNFGPAIDNVSLAVPGLCTAPPPGMVAWLTGDGNGNDLTGNGNNGALGSAVGFGQGMVAQAFQFSGAAGNSAVPPPDFVNEVGVPDSASLDITTAITIDAWVFPQLTATSDTDRIVNKFRGGGVGGPDGYGLDLQPGKRARLTLNNFAGPEVVSSPGAVQPNVWTHIAGTYDGTTAKIYINGVLNNSVAGTGPIATNDLPLRLGVNEVGNGRFTGLIDEVEIFSRALSDAEIQSIFAAGPSGKCKTMPDLGVTKTASSPALPGTTITFTIKVQNFGPGDSSGYTVVDVVPSSITNVGSTTPGCSVAGNTVTCTGGPILNGEIDTIIVTGKTPTNAAQTVVNTVTLTGNEPDPTPGNNSSTSTSTVDYPAGICRGTPLRLLAALELGTANPAAIPCATATNSLLSVTQPLPGLGSSVKAGVVTGTTTRGFGLAAATANVASTNVVALGLVTLSVGAVSSQAKSQAVAGCGTAVVSGKSNIAAITLKVLGLPVSVPIGNAPVSIPLLVGGLFLNQTTVFGSTVVQRALFLDLPGTLLDVVIGETTAGIGC